MLLFQLRVAQTTRCLSAVRHKRVLETICADLLPATLTQTILSGLPASVRLRQLVDTNISRACKSTNSLIDDERCNSITFNVIQIYYDVSFLNII